MTKCSRASSRCDGKWGDSAARSSRIARSCSALTRPELEAIASSDSAERFTSLRDRLEEAVQASRDARESIVGSFDVLLASTGQRTNEIMKVLTLASVLLLPGALIAGVMGMNFEVGIFETAAYFWVVLAIIATVAGRDARRRKGARVDLTEYRGSSLPQKVVHPSLLFESRSRRSRSSSGWRSPPARSSR